MSRAELRFSGIHIEHPPERERMEGAESRVWLGAVTPKGAIRQVSLSEDDLLLLLERAASFLRILRKRRVVGEHE